jgi:hypothetical protein
MAVKYGRSGRYSGSARSAETAPTCSGSGRLALRTQEDGIPAVIVFEIVPPP